MLAHETQVHDLTKKLKESEMKILPSVTPQKIEALAAHAAQMFDSKLKLEHQNKELRDKNNEMFLDLSYYQAQKMQWIDLEQRYCFI